MIPATVIEKIPQRANGTVAQMGDAVNFLIVASEADLKVAFQAAGWIQVGRTNAKPTASSAPQNNYLDMPMQAEMLFGKPQDFSFTWPALVTDLHARHDVRIWKALLTVNGQDLWVGAASHEGPWWDNNAGAVSYAAYPNTDNERDFLANSLEVTGLVDHFDYVAFAGESPKPRPAATNGSRPDGRIIEMKLSHLPP